MWELFQFMVHHNDGNCCLTAHRSGMRNMWSATWDQRSWVFKCNKSNSVTMKHIYNKYANFIKTYVVHIDTNGPLHLTEMVPVIGIGGMVSCACLHYMILLDTGHIDGLMQERCNSIANTLEVHLSCTNPSICRLVNCVAMEKLMSFPAEILSHLVIGYIMTGIYHITISSYHG